MITRRNVLWLAPTLLIITFPLWKPPVADFLSPRGNYDLENDPKLPTNQRFSMNGVTIMKSSQGKRSTNIRAEKVYFSNPANKYILYKVDTDIIGVQGNTTNVVANKGNYDIQKKRLKLKGKVVVTNPEDKTKLTTELLLYHEQGKKIHSPVPAVFTGDGIQIKGSSFHHDMVMGTYRVTGRVYCTIQGYTP